MAGIFDIFSGSRQQPAPAPQQQQQQQAPTEAAFQQSQNLDPQAQQQQQQGNPTPNPGTGSPLDEFAELFKIEENEEEEPASSDFFTYDPAKLKESVSGLNFTNSQNFQQLAAKAMSGDTEAFGEVLNQVARQVYAQTAELSIKVANRTAQEGYSRSMNDLPKSVRSMMSSENVSSLNEKFKHPAMQPLVNATRMQFEQKYPNLSPSEIAQKTNDYLTKMAKELSSQSDPTQRPNEDQQNSGEQDFADFFGLPSSTPR